jgi:hypothetical protein
MTVWSYVALMPQPHATKLSKQIPKNCLNIALISKTQVGMHIGVRINLILPFLHLVLSQYSPRILGTFRILLQFLKLLSGAKDATTTDSSSHNKNHDKIAQDCHLHIVECLLQLLPFTSHKKLVPTLHIRQPFLHNLSHVAHLSRCCYY